jgi:formylglycine-generating enzyme required for sulfatase activity
MGANPSSLQGRDLPVDTVTWFDCAQFCQRLNQSRLGSRYQFRLPTEAEWEYACRAGSRTAYCFGDQSADLADYGWYLDNGNGTTHPVAQLKPNAWGLYDMHGNVVEWCQDSRVPFSSAAQADPLVTDNGFGRINRGGSAWQDATYLRSASRGSNPQQERRRYLGLRVVVVPR